MKSKEEIIREEIRSLRDLLFRMIQWGVSVLVAVQTALFFVRKEIVKGLIERELSPGGTTKQAIDALVQSGQLDLGGYIPMHRYVIGTSFLFAVALIFSVLTVYGSNQYRHYRQLLDANLESDVTPPELKNGPRRLIVAMYMFFPFFDLLIRFFLPHL